MLSAVDSAAIRLGHWPSEYRLSAHPTRCLTHQARARCRLNPLKTNVTTTRDNILAAVSQANVRDHRRRPAGGRGALAARVTAGCRSVHRIVRFVSASLTDFELEGCHISWVWTRLLMS